VWANEEQGMSANELPSGLHLNMLAAFEIMIAL
jgi:hypothetical protein